MLTCDENYKIHASLHVAQTPSDSSKDLADPASSSRQPRYFSLGREEPGRHTKLACATSGLRLHSTRHKEADDFVNAHFSGDAKVLEAWRALKDPAVKSDLLRYLMLFIEGGISTDVNTEALKPIDVWVPETYRDRARVVIGIEWDQLDGGTWAEIPHRLQFCQWTIAAAPGHPLFIKMAYHTINSL